jgi:hypothetical protein
MEQVKTYIKLAKEHKKITIAAVIVVIMIIALVN